MKAHTRTHFSNCNRLSFQNSGKGTDLQTQDPLSHHGRGQITRLVDDGGLQNPSNCLHVSSPAFLDSATTSSDFLMSRFVTPSGRLNGDEDNVTAERRVAPGGAGGLASGKVVCGAVTSPHRNQTMASIQWRNVGGHRMHGPLGLQLTLCAPTVEHSQARGASPDMHNMSPGVRSISRSQGPCSVLQFAKFIFLQIYSWLFQCCRLFSPTLII